VLLLDEPMASLDPLARREFLSGLLEAAAVEGLTVVLSSHILAELERACDYLVILTGGRVQVAGEIDALLSDHRLLIGPLEHAERLAERLPVLKLRRTGRQASVLARTGGALPGPGWQALDVSLEQLVLAYLERAAGATAATGTTTTSEPASEVSAVQLVALILPATAGVFVGAPLLAQELEQRTNDFAWTQSVTRGRWLLAKLGLLALAAVAVAGLAATLIAWWERPIVDAGLWDAWAWFDHGLPLPAYALFAFALGVAVGALTRRTVVAMAVTLAIYAATRFAVSTWWRPRFRAPVETAIQRDDQLRGPNGAWILETFFRDGQGRRLTPEQATEVYNLQGGTLDTPLHDLLAQRGLTQHLSYHPADRLVPFELLEAGIFVMLATLLIGLAFWWIQRRTT